MSVTLLRVGAMLTIHDRIFATDITLLMTISRQV